MLCVWDQRTLKKKDTTEHRPKQQHNPKDSKSIQNISKTSQNIQKPYPRLIWSTKPQSPGLPRHRISHHPDEEMAWWHGMGWSFQHVESWCKICLDSEQKNTQHQLKIYSKSHWKTRKSLGCGLMFVKHCPRVESEKTHGLQQHLMRFRRVQLSSLDDPGRSKQWLSMLDCQRATSAKITYWLQFIAVKFHQTNLQKSETYCRTAVQVHTGAPSPL